ncbi:MULTISPECIES: FAD binding domain-containing protein [unclassified Bradyrhizobium]|uniref:FAD binding domain-containing protein n=1 Tax=unclassified Bradyrhizobium TaxID=2631580 RepID=UPI00211F07C3|nr:MULTISPECIES: xanthine dehydrogenase family protein subunit M [unclassified Bradyrhizobium]MDD1532541.1 FAD-binding molybdopterin dehydrogenase [Bradyrhizobium sp. WBOS8]MDD1582545.1 FAD-binding molybdopterin dehydrogenase [Bradyrhizobium sp. WBOS4]UUO50818.1 FAD-binding molybdopterin dehydrogenase [Bradyrhizobium sp. WBOS04]UUO58195.1 FAD-binding molybdopterin dehydrogenase [Bradyrhizobium sp. WBOS08]
MRPFSYQRATDPATAVRALGAAAAANDPLTQARAQPLAGGTTLIDLMKLDVMRPAAIVDINPLARSWSAIEPKGDGVRLGALAKMSDVAAHDEIQRSYPVIANSLKLAASAQLRNMATLGGNVMQRTRCSYFRDVSYDNCNKRNPGSGCAAMDGVNRMHAVLGVSDQCIATYPGDFAQALMALDATVEITGKSGARSLPFAQLHKAPGTTPEIETTLQPGELISAFSISGLWPRSVYLKARDRQSYEFALSSAAVALDVQNGTIRDARVALGGVATVPWRAREAEALLKGQTFDDGLAQRVADAAFADARGRRHNSFKIALGKRVVARALQQAATMEI